MYSDFQNYYYIQAVDTFDFRKIPGNERTETKIVLHVSNLLYNNFTTLRTIFLIKMILTSLSINDNFYPLTVKNHSK